MHPFSGRVCHQNEGIKQESRKHGNQRGKSLTQEGGEGKHKDDGRWKSPGNSGIRARKKKQSG